MMGPLVSFRLRSTLAAGALLALTASTPARAASFTVFWDRADYGFGAGIGVSEATATNASNAGIPIVSLSGLAGNTLPVDHDLTETSLVLPPSGPATITSGWSATNNVTDLNNPANPSSTTETLFLVYAHPTTNTIVVDNVSHAVTYAPSDVGLTLTYGAGGDNWVIIKTPIASTTDYAYLPAVSLGTLPFGEHDDFSLFYTLKNPKVFQGQASDDLGLPKWELAFVSTAAPIPEPSSGLLMFVGLLGIARARRKR
jgi:PEP-CTERM putative exosortase interaction domain